MALHKVEKASYYSTWLSGLQNLPNKRNYIPIPIWEYLDNFNYNRIYNMARKLFNYLIRMYYRKRLNRSS